MPTGMSMSQPFEPELGRREESSVRDTEGEDEPDVFLPRRGAEEAEPDDVENHLHGRTPYRHPDPDELQRG